MFEVWYQSGRTRKVVARFRILKDAEKYLAQHEGEGALEIVPAATESAPRARGASSSSASPSSRASHSSSPPPRSDRNSEPPATDGRARHHSGVRGRVRPELTGAAEHPDEFIADRVGNGDASSE